MNPKSTSLIWWLLSDCQLLIIRRPVGFTLPRAFVVHDVLHALSEKVSILYDESSWDQNILDAICGLSRMQLKTRWFDSFKSRETRAGYLH